LHTLHVLAIIKRCIPPKRRPKYYKSPENEKIKAIETLIIRMVFGVILRFQKHDSPLRSSSKNSHHITNLTPLLKCLKKLDLLPHLQNYF